jgi:hypothetical protein
VLVHARADGVRADEQHPLGAGEAGPQALGLVEVGVADVGAARGEVRQLLGPAGEEHDPRRVDAVEEVLGDEAAELAGGTGDDEAHGRSFGTGTGVADPYVKR